MLEPYISGNVRSITANIGARLPGVGARASLMRHTACPWTGTIRAGCPTLSRGVVGGVGEDQRGPAGFCGDRAVPPASADIALQLLLASRFPALDGGLTSLDHHLTQPLHLQPLPPPGTRLVKGRSYKTVHTGVKNFSSKRETPKVMPFHKQTLQEAPLFQLVSSTNQLIFPNQRSHQILTLKSEIKKSLILAQRVCFSSTKDPYFTGRYQAL